MAKNIISKPYKVENSFNRIPMGGLSAQEKNLVAEICVDLQDKGNTLIHYSKADLKAKVPFKNMTDKELGEMITNLDKKFFSLHFEQLIPTDDPQYPIHEFHNLFQVMRYKLKPDDFFLELQVDPHLAFLLNNVTKNFTRFELSDFISLRSKYSKDLFRLLMQFKSQGWWQVSLNDFRELLGAPTGYRFSDLERFVIKPSLKELSWDNGQTDLFINKRSAKRPVFKNLRVEKIKGEGRGRGGAVVALKFLWDPLKTPKLIKAETADVNTIQAATGIPVAEK